MNPNELFRKDTATIATIADEWVELQCNNCGIYFKMQERYWQNDENDVGCPECDGIEHTYIFNYDYDEEV